MKNQAVDDQTVADINTWADKQLRQWAKDVLERFEIAELPADAAMANVGATLLTLAARIFAASSVPEKEAGKILGDLITHMRRHVREQLRKMGKEMNDGC